MKIVKTNGLKVEILNLDYNIIKEEMKICERKGKTENYNSYSKIY